MPASPITYRAKYIVPVTSPPIENGYVQIRAGRVTEFGKWNNQSPAIDLGNVAILPAPVNAHTHLEFSDLESPLGTPGMEFTDWIRNVLAFRLNHPSPSDSIAKGLAESHQACTSLVGEIATTEKLTNATAPSAQDNHGVRFLELIGTGPERVQQQIQAATAYLSPTNQDVAKDSGWKLGLSPHAPYTVSIELLEAAVSLSQKHTVPLAMHLAETHAELELIQNQSGPFRTLLEERGVWNPTALSPNRDVLDYLQRLQSAHRSLVIHGNYLPPQHLEFLAEHSNNMTLVYCPRTHAYFQHDEYPLAEACSRGVHVALGTDSRASNPDLSLWSEFQTVATRFPQIDPAKILEMATINGATALGDTQGRGSINDNSLADLVVAELNEGGLYPSLITNQIRWLDS